MKIRTSDLTDIALDWAVAECLTGGELFQCGRVAHQVVLHSVGGTTAPYFMKDSGVIRCAFEPSENWSQGGPIIEREGIDIAWSEDGWYANMYWRGQDVVPGAGEAFRCGGDGPTPLIAAMRCYCCSKLGDIVDVPEELCQSQNS